MEYRIRTVTAINEIDATYIEKWQALEDSALEYNFYCSPAFVLSSLTWLECERDVALIFVELHKNHNWQLILYCGLSKGIGSPMRPCFTYQTLSNTYSFLNGLLISQTHAQAAINCFLEHLKKHYSRWSTIDFLPHKAGTQQATVFRHIATTQGFYWLEAKTINRAALILGGEKQLKLSKSVQKTRNKKLRQLQELGKVDYNLIFNKDISPEIIEDFLLLEHSGWKGKAGTSILSCTSHKHFIIELIAKAAKAGKVFFSIISVDNKMASCSVNFLSGSSAFAFKIARDEKLDKFSLGILNEIFLLEQIPHQLPQLKYFDSGAINSSYLDSLWPDKIKLTSGYLTHSLIVHAFLRLRHKLHEIWIFGASYCKKIFEKLLQLLSS